MRRRWTIGLLAVALAAFAGYAAAGASATNLCSAAPVGANECEVGKAYGAGQVFAAESFNSEVFSPLLGAVRCAESELRYKVTKFEVGVAAQAELQNLDFETCENQANVACEVTAGPLPGKVQVLATAGGNGTVFVEPAGGPAVFTIETECGFPCPYTAAEVTGAFTGGGVAKTVFAQKMNGVPGGCGGATFKGLYSATKPQPVWATK